jgi:colanic acid biosynthesis glycosyl transferase WcaI
VRLCIVNLFYPPDLAPSGHLVASLAEHRASMGDEVTVVTGTGSYVGGRDDRAPEPGRVHRAGVRVIRLWTPSLGKQSVPKRMGDYLTFLAAAVLRLARMPRQDVIVALTSPPYIVVAAVAHRLLHPRTRIILWSHDVYPDAAEAFGTIRAGGVASTILRAWKRWLLRSVDHVVAVDRAMLHRVLTGYARDGRPTGSVIPTWEPLDLFPADSTPQPWTGYDDPAIAGRFVVLHLGNLGFGHRTDTIAEVAARSPEATFLFVGGGVRFAELAQEASRRRLENIVFRDYVPKELTPSVLAGAGCTFISLDDRSLGIMSPCKMNGSLAMSMPIVYAGPPGSNVDEAIATYGCGFSLRQGDVEGLTAAIERLREDPELVADLSKKARLAFEDAHCDRRGLERFDALLAEILPRPRASAGEIDRC